MIPCQCNDDIPILNCKSIDINRPINSYYLGYRYKYLNVGASYPYSNSYYIDKSINKYYKHVSCIAINDESSRGSSSSSSNSSCMYMISSFEVQIVIINNNNDGMKKKVAIFNKIHHIYNITVM